MISGGSTRILQDKGLSLPMMNSGNQIKSADLKADEPNRNIGDYFGNAYQDVMYTGVIGLYSKFVHALMERPFRNTKASAILEVGAGMGQHVPFVTSLYDSYTMTDKDSFTSQQLNVADPRVSFVIADAQDLSGFESSAFDRLVATCLLAHLDQPEQALLEWRRVVKTGGHLTIYIPAEPGMLLRFLRFSVVAPKSRRNGQDHISIVCRDHRNHYPGMREMIRDIFRHDAIKRIRFPSRFLGWNFSLFEIYQIQISKE